MNKKTVTVLV